MSQQTVHRIWQQNFWQNVRLGGVYCAASSSPPTAISRKIGFRCFCFYDPSLSPLLRQLPSPAGQTSCSRQRAAPQEYPLRSTAPECSLAALASTSPVTSSPASLRSTRSRTGCRSGSTHPPAARSLAPRHAVHTMSKRPLASTVSMWSTCEGNNASSARCCGLVSSVAAEESTSPASPASTSIVFTTDP